MSVYSLKERKLMDSVNTLFREAVKAIVSALEAKDPYTYGHSLRVSEYALLMGEAIKLSKEDLLTLELGALLHDIGKIGTPDHILLKPGHLTEEEFEIMKKHPVQSAEILSHIELLKDVVPIVKYHQERMDGLGYPDGLKGEQIPLLCRIVY
ncbi:MAG: HD domain-containing protein, partial [Deltaproteobacteria bacterium]|nr:HD domain-containing protein [Deltaproteobacteria bacterium]